MSYKIAGIDVHKKVLAVVVSDPTESHGKGLATTFVRCLQAMRTLFVVPALDAQLGQGTRQ